MAKRIKTPPPCPIECADEGATRFVSLAAAAKAVKPCPGVRILTGKTQLPTPQGIVEYSPDTCQPPRLGLGQLSEADSLAEQRTPGHIHHIGCGHHYYGCPCHPKPPHHKLTRKEIRNLKKEFLGSFADPESVLEEALKITSGARPAKYGTPKENHSRTAKYWSIYLGIELNARQVCIMNILQKISRDMHSPNRDNVVDIAGFAQNADDVSKNSV